MPPNWGRLVQRSDAARNTRRGNPPTGDGNTLGVFQYLHIKTRRIGTHTHISTYEETDLKASNSSN